MKLRALLSGLIIVATAAFVVGTTIERHDRDHESDKTHKAEGATATQVKHQTTPSAQTRPTTSSRGEPSKRTRTATTDEHAGESAEQRRAEGLPAETTTEAVPRSSANAGASSAGHLEGTGGESAAEHAAEGAGAETHAELMPLGVDIEAVPFVVLAVLASFGLAAAAWSRPRSVLLLVAVAGAMLAFAALDVREVFHQNDEAQTGLAVFAGAVAALHLAAALVAGLMALQATSQRPGAPAPLAR
jgi:hypothetical protein